MLLAEYIEGRRAQGYTLREFAGRIGAHEVSVANWIAGKHRPQDAFVARIVKATRGKVTADDLLAPWEARERKRKRKINGNGRVRH
jgi:transcriptional regulator with XRE-family HTH domain